MTYKSTAILRPVLSNVLPAVKARVLAECAEVAHRHLQAERPPAKPASISKLGIDNSFQTFKHRETKLQPSRGRSDHHPDFCIVSLPFIFPKYPQSIFTQRSSNPSFPVAGSVTPVVAAMSMLPLGRRIIFALHRRRRRLRHSVLISISAAAAVFGDPGSPI